LTWQVNRANRLIFTVHWYERMRRTRFQILLLLLILIISTTSAVIIWHVQFDRELAVTTWTYPDWRTGIENEETSRFLAWAKLKSDLFCRVDMNSVGETIIVTTDICWCTTDDEIQVIANIATLNKVKFRADFATDRALDYLAANPRLKEIQTIGEMNGFTANGLRDFHARRPDIKFNL
jgi:hypothetical protein